MKEDFSPEEIKDKIDKFFKDYNELKALNANAKSELSEIDKELSSQYHKIEGSEIAYMSDSHFLIMKLRDILKKRRDAKINQTLLESLISSLEPQMIKCGIRNIEIIQKHDEIIEEIKNRAK